MRTWSNDQVDLVWKNYAQVLPGQFALLARPWARKRYSDAQQIDFATRESFCTLERDDRRVLSKRGNSSECN